MIAGSAILLSLAAGISALPAHTAKRQSVREFLFQGIEPATDLVWHPCNETQEYPYQCARLSVPLDYQKPDNGLRAVVPIIKYPTNATGADYKGAVLFNPGGPGYLTTEPLWRQDFAQSLVDTITGPGWDLIGFDTRGIGYSVPYSACGLFPDLDPIIDPKRSNASVLEAGHQRRVVRRSGGDDTGFGGPDESSHGIYIPGFTNEQIIDAAVEFGDTIDKGCGPVIGAYNQAGPHMNTAATATDMLTIAKAIARQKGESCDNILVNYYGISYGTVLGQTFATMYPKNVGKFFLDGVVNMHGWQTRSENQIFRHTDEGFDKFFELCSKAGTEACAFHTGSTPEDIKARFNNMTARFSLEPWTGVPGGEDIVAALVTGLRLFKGKILDSLYDAVNQFPGLSVIFAALDETTSAPFEQWNVTLVQQILSLPLVPPNPNRIPAPLVRYPHSFYQTACTDAYNIIGVNITGGEVDAARKVSIIAGHQRISDRIVCTRYSIRPAWNWRDTIGAKETATPILFAGNLLDPVTPWEDARDATKNFPGSSVIYLNIVAHAIPSSSNTCAFKKVQAYFQDGTLPEFGTTCEDELPPFSPETHPEEIIASFGL